MLKILIKSYPFTAPIVWIWFWAALFELINPAIKWYFFPLVLTMIAVLLYLLFGTLKRVNQILKDKHGIS